MSKTMTYAELGDFDVITSQPTKTSEIQRPRYIPSTTSKHEEAYRKLKQMILHGELRYERDFLLQPLAEKLDVSRNTLTRALNRLVEDELVRHSKQKGYTLLLPTAQQIERWYGEAYELVREALVADEREKRPRQYGLDRDQKLALAEVLPELAAPQAVAAELDEMLRTAVSRSGDSAKRTAFHAVLQRLASARRVEHLVISDHREDVAQLMRSFYRGQYDRFLRMFSVYTTKRVRAASATAAQVHLWASGN